MAARFLDDERLAELLTDRAVEGLESDAKEELERLAAQYPDYEEEALDEVAAALALTGLKVEPLPAHLRERIESDARRHFSDRKVVTFPRAGRRSGLAWAGWFAAAASVLLAAAGWWRAQSLEAEVTRMADARAQLSTQTAALEEELGQIEERLDEMTPPAAAAPAQARAALADRPGTVSWPWTPTGDPAAEKASGDVVWNGDAQQGYMRFEGLAANDPARQQYQLWIFDAERDERYPVDGGVFNVPEGAGEVIVPIRAKLPVGKPALFAVTVERPGGVVVSSRDRIAVVAQPGA